MNRFISKATVFVALAIMLFSCKNDDTNDDLIGIDVNKELTFTAPDGTPLVFEEEFTFITKNADTYFLFATTDGKKWNQTVTLAIDLNNLDQYKPKEELKISLIRFGMFASSDSESVTNKYNGKIFLLKYTEKEASIYFDNVSFSIRDDIYNMDGKYSFSIKNE
jgi:hypothetical protein